jgi:SAM-dependent methyltransferase
MFVGTNPLADVYSPDLRTRGARCAISPDLSAEGYDRFYQDFDSELTRQLRLEAYGDDIGQYSWVTKKDLESDVARLQLRNASQLLDLGCGPGGALTHIVGMTGCRGIGIDVSVPAIAAARRRAESFGLAARLSFQQADLNQPLPFREASFEAAVCLDVILHLRDRSKVFREMKRILIPGGRFLLTDAAVLTGLVCAEEFRVRASRGYTQFVPPGLNERLLQEAGFSVVDVTDRTASLLQTAKGRLNAQLAHRRELEDIEGEAEFQSEQDFLAVVVELSERRSLSRMTYLAQTGAD